MSTIGKTIKCKAAVAWAPSQPLTIEEIEVAPPQAHEVRVKLSATGICHTDLSGLNLLYPVAKFPAILGHEGAGVVESVGEGVTNVSPGDHVVLLFRPQCKECKFCKNPKTNFCDKIHATQAKGVLPEGTTRFKCKGQDVSHFMGTSTFTEFTVVADISLCKVNPKAPLNKICLLGCGISTGYGAALNNAGVEPGSTCAIWGLGAIGLACVMGCKKAGASRIIGIDLNPGKFEIAKEFGCTDFVNPLDHPGEDGLANKLIEMTQGGLDFTFECVGNIQAIESALKSAHIGWGMSVIVGVAPVTAKVEILPSLLLLGRKWTGSAFGGWKSVESVPKLVEEYLEKRMKLDEFVSHTMGLEGVNEGFELMKQGKSIRSVIEF